MKKKIMKALGKAIDPETGIDVVSMGMIKKVEEKDGNVKIKFTPTTPFCPMIGYLVQQIEQAAKTVKGVKKVEVEVTA
jgi:metal-sulfur cluster biosynthetic enzyme